VARVAATSNGLGTDGTRSPEVRHLRIAGPVGGLPTTSRPGEIKKVGQACRCSVGTTTDAGSIPAASIKVRRHAVNTFHNLYLLAGLRGTFAYDGSLDVALAETALLDTLTDRWGVAAPWGRCDSGADLETPGDGVVRGWSHVDFG
jgi:hypothetical protein